MSKDELHVEASSKGGSIRVVGDVASRLGNQLADIMSPFSGLAGILGDEIEAYRGRRREALATALHRAGQIKEERNEMKHPIHSKMLSPWIEKVINEDLESENIVEIWARLLASFPKGFDALAVAFIDACSRLGPKEIEIFQWIFLMKANWLSSEMSDDVILSPEYLRSENDSRIAKFVENKLDFYASEEAIGIARTEGHVIYDWVFDCSHRLEENSFILVNRIGLTRVKKLQEWAQGGSILVRVGSTERRNSILSLFSANMIASRAIKVENNGVEVLVHFYEPTDFGIAFARSVIGNLNEKFSQLSDELRADRRPNRSSETGPDSEDSS